MSNYAIDTAARFGEIPFVEFTKELVTGVFDSLVESHITQMENYANFVASVSQDLSTYINNTVDGVTFEQIQDFVLAYQLPTVTEAEMDTIMTALQSPTATSPTAANPTAGNPATPDTWWGGLINGLAPAVNSLVDKLPDPSAQPQLTAISDYNSGVLSTVPTYKQIHDAIASLISSNKYSILQNIVNQGAMRLVVTEGEIETKITFSTWQESESTNQTTYKQRQKEKEKMKGRIKPSDMFKRGKGKTKGRTVTVNTAKSYQRDTSGTKVDIFGRVLIKFKTDYAPLNS